MMRVVAGTDDWQSIVIVPATLTGRTIVCCHVVAGNARHRLRKELLLNTRRQRQLLLDLFPFERFPDVP